ncbi:MAG: serine hydrolase domain-containing protein [Myxococcaceae bacterium]
MSGLKQLLDEGVATGVFPSAQATVIHKGKRVFEASVGPASLQTVFDLASVTKVLSTTALFMAFWAEGRLGPEAKLSRFFPDSAAGKAGVTLVDLLYHRSGLPAFRPYFARVMPAVPELFDPACPPKVWSDVRHEVVEAVKKSGLERPIGERAVYSDLGFILLGEVLAHAGGAELDSLFEERIARKLGLHARYRRPSAKLDNVIGVAPTGTTRPREPDAGQEKLWEPFPAHPAKPGEVDDDNAWVMDGVSGHAGVFGRSGDLAQFGQRVLEDLQGAGHLAPAPLWARALQIDAQTPGSTRAMGFDTPAEGKSSSGSHFRRAVGHLGFTGTSLWIDLDRELSVALCTNRTAMGRANILIREFRPTFHDGVIRALALES